MKDQIHKLMDECAKKGTSDVDTVIEALQSVIDWALDRGVDEDEVSDIIGDL